MKIRYFIIFLVIMGVALTVYSRGRKEQHVFEKNQCWVCHEDLKGDPMKLRNLSSDLCEDCHKGDSGRSHPVDFEPSIPPPADMPLVDGKMTCITCHFVHLFSVQNKKSNFALLRRPGRGPVFCGTCHNIDEQGHIVFSSIHGGSYKTTNPNERIDSVSLQCVGCHDDYMTAPVKSLGSGTWLHFQTKLNHPVGISYARVAARNPKDFVPKVNLNPKIELYDGKIGCGSCHNVYSKDKFMLTVSNYGSKLCLECHSK